MYKAGDLAKSKPKTNDEKYLWWDGLCTRLLEHYEIQKKSDAISEIEYQMLVGEIRGGVKCKACGISWKEVRFNDSFGMGLYYKPACGCSPKCPVCHRSLHIEHALGKLVDQAWCEYCGAAVSVDAIRKQYDKTEDPVIQRQIYMRRRNACGEKCVCGHDLWYELKAQCLSCGKCGREVKHAAH